MKQDNFEIDSLDYEINSQELMVNLLLGDVRLLD